jgi:hypothetical protein
VFDRKIEPGILTKTTVDGESDDAGPKILILLDTSAAMDGTFEDGTKIQAATATIDELVANLQDPSFTRLALRRYGGPCEGDNTELDFPFEENSEDAFRGLLENIAVAGETTLVAGIEAAAGDFTGLDRSGGPLQAVIITGAGDSCQGDLSEKLEQLSDLGIEVTLSAQREGLNLAATAIGSRIRQQPERLVLGADNCSRPIGAT